MSRLKRLVTIVTTMSTIFWSMGGSFLFTNIARAAVVANGPYELIPTGGMHAPANSFDMPLFRFSLNNTASETLSSVTVTVLNATSGAVTNDALSSHLKQLNVFKDTNGNGAFDPGVDGFGGSVTEVHVATSTTVINLSQNNSIAASGTLPTSFFVMAQTGAGWAGADAFKVSVGTGGIVTSGGAATITAFTTTNAVDAQSGGGGGGFAVTQASYVNATTIDVTFSDTLYSNNAVTSTANYTLSTAAGADNETVSQVTVLPDNKSVRVVANGATIASTGTDTIAVNNQVKNIQGFANGNTSPMSIGSSFQSLVISEISAGTVASSSDEFIEIYNRTSSVASLTNFKLHLVNAAGTADTNAPVTLLNGITTVAAHKFLLIAAKGSTASTTADGVYTTTAFADIVPNGAAYISYNAASSTAVIDRVCWGSHGNQSDCEGAPASASTISTGGSIERKAFNASTVVSMIASTDGNGVDTQNNSFDFVSRDASQSQNSTAAAETPSAGSNSAPTIQHASIFQAASNAALSVVARMSDDGGQLTTGNTQMIYCTANVTCVPASSTPIYGTSIGSGWYKFSLSSTSTDLWSSGRSKLLYYLQAADSSSPAKTSVFTNDPTYDSTGFNHDWNGIPSAALETSKALVVNLSSSNLGSAGISGTVQSSAGAAISGATVWVDGSQFAATTGNDGTFSFSNVGPSGGVQIKIAKEGYVDQSISTFLPASGILSLGTIVLYSGTMGQGGDFNSPKVMNTFPMQGMIGAPTQTPNNTPQPIDVFFSKTMDATTVTDADASDSGSNIYLTEAGSNTKIAGAVSMPGTSQARFTPSANLTVGKSYTLFVTPAVKDSVGNPISGNSSGGMYVLSFSTAGQMFTDFSQITNFGTGTSFPPYIVGTQPSQGKTNVALNTKLVVIFSEAMQNSATNLANIKLYSVTGAFTSSEVKTEITGLTRAFDSSAKIAILTPGSNLTSSGHYRIEVLGGITSAKGIPLGNPTQSGFATTVFYKSDFDAGTGADTTAPMVNGTVPASSATNVSTIKPITVNFSEAMNPSTISDSSVLVKLGSTAVTGNLSYDSNNWTATFVPTYAFTATSTYTINVTTDVQDLAGNALATALLRTFTTGSADTSSPGVASAQTNDYAAKVVFTKPMLSVGASDANYSGSVLNPNNYTLRVVNGSGVQQSVVTLPSTATFTYDATTRSVAINGMPSITGFTAGTTLINIVVANVKDVGFNVIGSSINSATSTAQSSASTGSFTFSGGAAPMLDASGNMIQGGSFGPMPNEMKTFSDSGIGFIPSAKVYPFNTMAGVNTTYGVEAPISKQIPNGGYLDLTFSGDTDVSLAKKDTNSPANNDLNGPGPGAVVFATAEGTLASGWTTGGQASDGVIVNADSHIVRIILGAVATRCSTDNTTPCASGDQHDFLRADIAQITNPTISQGLGTSGNTTTVETKKSDGTVIESLSAGAFLTTASGIFTVHGQVMSGANGVNGAKVFLMSPMTGPQSTSTAQNVWVSGVDSNNGTFQFTGLVTSTYMLGVENYFKSGGTTYTASFPTPINVNYTNCSTASTCTQNISVTNASTGATVTLKISGIFSSNDVDIFAGGPGSFRMATTTLDGTLTNDTSNSMKLNVNGVWMIGFGPAMNKDLFAKGAGSVTAPAWIIPKPQEVQISGCPSSCVASPTTVSFSVTAANKTIKFTVKDASGNALGQAHVFAYSPQASVGSDTTANADGTGSINLSYGTYKIGADVFGMPGGAERSITIKDVSGTDKVFVDGSTTGITLSTMTVASLVLTVSKPAYTITGKVTDGTNAAANVPVNAFRADGQGHADTFTNTSGDYTLYVGNGTWTVQAFSPDYGKLSPKTATVNGANVALSNFEPASTLNYGTLTKSIAVDTNADAAYVAADDEELGNVQVIVEGTTSAGENYINTTLTDTNGSSTMKLPPGTYTMKAWSPTIGQLPAFSSAVVVSSAGTVTTEPANLLAPRTANVTVNILDSAGVATSSLQAVVEFEQIGGKIDKVESFSNIASSTLVMPRYDAGADNITINSSTSTNPSNFYLMKVTVPGISNSNLVAYGADSNTIMATSSAVSGLWKVEVDSATENINIRLPAIDYISGTVKDDVGAAVPDATVHLQNKSTNEIIDVQADTSGNYSTKVSAGTYLVQADKKGYVDTASTVTISANGALADSATTMTTASYSLTGTIKAGGTAANGATVKATKLGGGTVTATTASDGTYTLKVTGGDWKLGASADGYNEFNSPTAISVTGNTTAADINLTATNTSLAGSTALSVTPQTGGSLSDSSANLSISAPPTALANSANTYSLNEKETSNVVGTGAGKPIAGEAKTISGSDNNGNGVSVLKSEVAVGATYSTTDLTTSLGSLTMAKIEKVQMASFDTTADTWQNLPTTVAYKNSSGNFVEPASDLSNVASVAYTGQTLHFSVFNPINPADGLSPAAPTGITVSGGAHEITVTWTAPTTNADDSVLSDLLGYEIYRATSANGSYTQLNGSDITGTSYVDPAVVAGTTYYYKVTAADNGGLESAMSSASAGVALSSGSSPTLSAGTGGGSTSVPNITISLGAVPVSLSTGGTTASSRNITLKFDATNATAVAISEKADFADASFVTYSATKDWVLSAGTGAKTIYVKFRSSSGNLSEAKTLALTLTGNDVVVAPNAPASPSAPAVVNQNAGTSNVTSNVVMTAPVVTSFQPGATLKFNYQYVNNGAKVVAVKIVRQLLNSKGKAVITAQASKLLKVGAAFKGEVNQKLDAKLPAGDYVSKVKILDAKTGKVLSENSFSVKIEPLKKKIFVLGSVSVADGALMFDQTSLSRVKSNTGLPVILKLKYGYTNGASQATVKMVRQLLGPDGKVLATKTGKITAKAGEKVDVSFTQPVAGNLSVGSYTIRLRAYDWKNGQEILAENALGFGVELK